MQAGDAAVVVPGIRVRSLERVEGLAVGAPGSHSLSGAKVVTRTTSPSGGGDRSTVPSSVSPSFTCAGKPSTRQTSQTVKASAAARVAVFSASTIVDLPSASTPHTTRRACAFRCAPVVVVTFCSSWTDDGCVRWIALEATRRRLDHRKGATSSRASGVYFICTSRGPDRRCPSSRRLDPYHANATLLGLLERLLHPGDIGSPRRRSSFEARAVRIAPEKAPPELNLPSPMLTFMPRACRPPARPSRVPRMRGRPCCRRSTKPCCPSPATTWRAGPRSSLWQSASMVGGSVAGELAVEAGPGALTLDFGESSPPTARHGRQGDHAHGDVAGIRLALLARTTPPRWVIAPTSRQSLRAVPRP